MRNFIQRFQRVFLVRNILIFIIIAFFFSFFLYRGNEEASYKKIPISYRNKNISAFIADTPQKQRRGLAVRSSIGDNEAMLFVFPRSDIYPFWMKDMQFPIDIVWLDADKKVVFIKEHAQPKDFPETYTPNRRARYVIEFVDGFVEKNNVQVGDEFKWDENKI